MNKVSLRKIKVANETYLWKRGHYHLDKFVHSKCAEKVIIYLEGYKNTPLHLLFREEDNVLFKPNLEMEKWCVGYPDTGVIWLYQQKTAPADTIYINLNRPAAIATLITHFIDEQWKPKEDKKPLVIQHGLLLLENLVLPMGIN